MNAELVFFGKSLSMAARQRRRVLVVSIYASLAALMTALWFFGHWRGTSAYVFWAAMLACRLFLGGYYGGGLVKPFNGKAPKQSSMPPPLLLLKLHIYQSMPAPEAAYRNDEREVHQRDHAHYLAYQVLGVALLAPWLLATLRVIKPELPSRFPMSPDEMYLGLLMIAVMLFLTLPQSILLWTEPDMEAE